MTLVSKILKVISLIFIVIITSCSLDEKSGLWTKRQKVVQEQMKLIKLTVSDDILDKEFNSKLQIKFKKKGKTGENWLSSDKNLSNLVGHMNFNGEVNKSSKFKFKKVIKRKLLEPDLIITNNFVVFYNNNGSILKFDKGSKLQWKTKVYNKKERNGVLNVSLALSNKVIYVADNLGRFYSLDINTGKIIWKKFNESTFNSQLKIIDNKMLVIDSNNTLWCFSTKDGSSLWSVKTQGTLIKSLKKLSMVIYKDSVIFSNSIGDLSRVDLENGELIWQSPTQNNLLTNETDFLKSSDLVLYKNTIYISNNNNEFYSIDADSGIINWIQNVNSYLRPIIIEDLIFTISKKGYLIVINSNKGEIIRSTYLLSGFKKKLKRKISFEGFIIASNNIYTTTNNGRLFVYKILDGKLKQIYKIGKFRLSEPFINNDNLYIIKSNSIVVLN